MTLVPPLSARTRPLIGRAGAALLLVVASALVSGCTSDPVVDAAGASLPPVAGAGSEPVANGASQGPAVSVAPIEATLAPAADSPVARAVALRQGGQAPFGFWYAVEVSAFAPGSTVSVGCFDSIDGEAPFFIADLVVGPDGSVSDEELCYSADGPDHWVVVDGLQSSTVAW